MPYVEGDRITYAYTGYKKNDQGELDEDKLKTSTGQIIKIYTSKATGTHAKRTEEASEDNPYILVQNDNSRRKVAYPAYCIIGRYEPPSDDEDDSGASSPDKSSKKAASKPKARTSSSSEQEEAVKPKKKAKKA